MQHGRYCTFAIAMALLHFRTPFFLLMIHHEETRLNANRNPAPKGGGGVEGVRMCNSAERMLKAMYTWY